MEKPNLNDHIRMMRDAGCEPDQIQNLYRGYYFSLVWAAKFHAAARQADRPDGPVEIAMGGARGPGKSFASLAQVGLDDCQRFDGLHWLFLRRIAKSAKESFENIIQKLFMYVPHNYTPSNNLLTFANNSTIRMGGFKNEGDIDSYLGIEYDGIVIEEATGLSLNKKNMVQGSLRTSRRDWRPRLYLTTNPGMIGHAWFKAAYVMPYRNHTETLTRFIPGTYRDNPWLNKEYIDYLERLPGALGKAWRDGDWDSFEGMAFPTWLDDEHVCEPHEIPAHWTRWRAVDWGYSAPMCCLWFARDPDNGRVIIYREAYQAGLTDRQQARIILDMTTPDEKITLTFADPSMWTSKTSGVTVTTTADVYSMAGVPLTRGDNDRLSGKRKVDRILANLPDGKPGLMVFSNCQNLRRTLPELVGDPVRVEDVDTRGEDHAYDTLKYGLTQVREYQQVQAKTKVYVNPFYGR